MLRQIDHTTLDEQRTPALTPQMRRAKSSYNTNTRGTCQSAQNLAIVQEKSIGATGAIEEGDGK